MADAPLKLFHVFSTFAVGGQQTRFCKLAEALGDGYAHVVMAMDGKFDAAELVANTVNAEVRRTLFAKSRLVSLDNVASARRMMKADSPHILCTYNFGSIDWAFANRIAPLAPHIHFEDGFGPDEAGGRQLPRRVWARRAALSGRAHTVVPSRVLEKIARGAWGLPAERLHYIPNGVDCARFENVPDPLRLRRGANEVVIGTIGSLRAEKNFHRLIRVFAELSTDRPLRLVIAGDGAERAALEADVAARGLQDRVDFLGFISEPERVLADCDIFVLSSDTEQMPISLVEAMAAGLPAASTDVGDVRDMLPQAQHDFLTDKTDKTALAESLKTLAEDAALRTRLGAANRETARDRFDLKTMVETYDALFRRLAAVER